MSSEYSSSKKDAASTPVLKRMVDLIERGCGKKLAASIAVAETHSESIKHEEKLADKKADIED